MPDTILVIGASQLHTYTVNEAHALGLRVVVTDQSLAVPAMIIADECIALDVYDIVGHKHMMKRLCQREHVVGVVCCGGDSAPTVAACCEVVSTPGIPLAVAKRTWDKYEVRFALEKAGLAHYQPRWQRLNTRQTYGMSVETHVNLVGGFPCVIKPLSQRASRGVHSVDNIAGLWKAGHDAVRYGDILLLEEHLTGSEHSAEIVLDAAGQCVHFHCSDRFFDYTSGVPLELGHINHSCLTPDKQARIKAMVCEAAQALGVHIGSFKCDVMWTLDGPKILECAARCSGGYDAQRTYPESSGDNLLRRVIQVVCGMPYEPQPDPLPRLSYVACAAILPQKAGIVHWLPQTNEDVVWHISVGDSIHYPLAHNAHRLGFVFARSQEYDEAWALAKAGADMLAGQIEVA